MKTHIFTGATLLGTLLPLLASSVPAATFVVTNTDNAGSGSFRQAVLDANTTTDLDIIEFAAGITNINLSSSVIASQPIIIDGGVNEAMVTLTGPGSGDGVTLQGANSAVYSMGFTNFNIALIVQPGAVGAMIGDGGRGNLFSGNGSALTLMQAGGHVRGNTVLSGSGPGITIFSIASNITIGGSTTAHRNVLSGQSFSAISVNGSGHQIIGNYIGTNADATAASANDTGVLVNSGTSGIVIGGDTAAERNVISGNTSYGIRLTGSATIKGNYIGTNAAGTASIPNNVGISTLSTANGLTITNNLISGNNQDGILAAGSNYVIRGNRIGVNEAGTAALGNGRYGIWVSGGTGTVVGGPDPEHGNLISGNSSRGITTSATCTITNNFIGTNAAGTAAIPNGLGIFLSGTGPYTVGSPGAGNLISGNSNEGIFVNTGNVTIRSNHIGTNADATAAIPNTTGIHVASLGGGTVIGGTDPADGNIVAGNTGNGLNLLRNSIVRHNFIGTDATASLSLGNGQNGINIEGSVTGTIIGDATGTNTIAHNGRAGIQLNTAASGVRISRNALFGNAFGIGLGLRGPLYNDSLDADAGSNNRQNHPILDPIEPAATNVTGRLHSRAERTYTIELFRSSTRNASRHGEGAEFLLATDVVTDVFGNADFDFLLAEPAAADDVYTATATDITETNAETGGFSRAVVVGRPSPTVASIVRAPGQPANTSDSEAEFAVTFTEPVTDVASDDFALTLTGHSGASIQSITSVMGNAALIDGIQSSGFTVPSVDAPNLVNASFTVEAWAKLDPAATGAQYLLSYGGADSTNNRLSFGLRSTGAATIAFWNNDLDSTYFPSEIMRDWTYLAGTYEVSTGERRLYIDGILVASQTGASPLAGHGDLRIGGNHLSGFNGLVDEVRIWNHARTQSELNTSRFAPLQGDETGLLAYYTFDEITSGLPDVLEDNSPNGADAQASATGVTLVPSQALTADYSVTVTTGTGTGSIRLDAVPAESLRNEDYYPMTDLFTTGETVNFQDTTTVREWEMIQD